MPHRTVDIQQTAKRLQPNHKTHRNLPARWKQKATKPRSARGSVPLLSPLETNRLSSRVDCLHLKNEHAAAGASAPHLRPITSCARVGWLCRWMISV